MYGPLPMPKRKKKRRKKKEKKKRKKKGEEKEKKKTTHLTCYFYFTIQLLNKATALHHQMYSNWHSPSGPAAYTTLGKDGWAA